MIKFTKTIKKTITKEIIIPFNQARHLLIWDASNGNVILAKMNQIHIHNTIKFLKSFRSSTIGNKNYHYHGYSRTEWILIFTLELKYRDLVKRGEKILKEIDKFNKLSI